MVEEQEVELIDYLNIIWKRKLLILGGTMLAAVTALGVSLSMPKTYEASVTLHVPTTFQGNFRNQSISKRAIDRFTLGEEPYNLSPLSFLNSILSVDTRGGSNLTTLRVAFSDPELAKQIANFVADEAVRVHQRTTLTTRESIRQQLELARDVFKTPGRALVRFKETAKLESLKVEKEILIAERTRLVRDLSQVTTDLEGNRARIARLQEELKRQQPLVTLTKSIPIDRALLAAAKKRGVSGLEGLSVIRLKSQEINRVYESLLDDLVGSSVRQTELESKRADLEGKLKANVGLLEQGEAEIARKEGKLEELTQDYTLAKQTYERLANELQKASRTASLQVNELKIVDRAMLPRDPVKPRVKLNVALAGTVGLMMFTFVAFFLEYIEKARRRGG